MWVLPWCRSSWLEVPFFHPWLRPSVIPGPAGHADMLSFRFTVLNFLSASNWQICIDEKPISLWHVCMYAHSMPAHPWTVRWRSWRSWFTGLTWYTWLPIITRSAALPLERRRERPTDSVLIATLPLISADPLFIGCAHTSTEIWIDQCGNQCCWAAVLHPRQLCEPIIACEMNDASWVFFFFKSFLWTTNGRWDAVSSVPINHP